MASRRAGSDHQCSVAWGRKVQTDDTVSTTVPKYYLLSALGKLQAATTREEAHPAESVDHAVDGRLP